MFKNGQELTEFIKQIKEERGITVMEAVIHICEKYDIEIETIAAYIRQSHKLKEELRLEAIQNKMVNE